MFHVSTSQTHLKQVPAQLLLHQPQQGLAVCNGCRLQGHGQQLQPHVDHHLRVVAVMRVGERDEEAEEFSDTWQPIWDQSCP